MTPSPTPDDPAVHLVGVDRRFGAVQALDDLDLAVPRHRITVLLGPNGAGKTTAIRVITGALSPDRGTVRVFGLDPDRDGEDVRRRCGVVSAKPALYDRLSGYDNMAYSAALYGLGRRVRDRIVEAAARFGIDHALDQQVGGYSTGMKTRLALARSVLHQPELLLFDEPTSGLDPESSTAVLELIREMTGEGRTVVMCTHLLVEAEGLADHIVIMEGGTALIAGSPAELTSRFWPHPAVAIGAEDPRLLERMRSWPGVLGLRLDNTGARVELDDLARIPDLVASLAADGVRIGRVEPFSPNLEDLYFLIRRQLSGEARAAGREVKGALDPVATGALAPSAGMGPRSTTADRMPTMTVPDSLGTDQDVASTEQRGSGS